MAHVVECSFQSYVCIYIYTHVLYIYTYITYCTSTYIYIYMVTPPPKIYTRLFRVTAQVASLHWYMT